MPRVLTVGLGPQQALRSPSPVQQASWYLPALEIPQPVSQGNPSLKVCALETDGHDKGRGPHQTDWGERVKGTRGSREGRSGKGPCGGKGKRTPGTEWVRGTGPRGPVTGGV